MRSMTRDERPERRGHLPIPGQRDRATATGAPPARPLLAHQRALGNQAIQRFATTCPLALPAPSFCPFGGVCHQCPPRVQAKVAISQPGDRYEQEADRVADAVMRMPEPQPGASQVLPRGAAGLAIRRMIAPAARVPDGGSSLRARLDALRGAPLPASERAFFEPRFGYEFSKVRVHTDRRAPDTARSVSARAFTYGNDVVFGAGEYNPGTYSGRKLLAHELAHVVQQNSRPGLARRMIQRRELRGEDFPWQGVVANCSWVWFRKNPDMAETSRIRALKAGTEVQITGKSDSWLKVKYNGVDGYIYKNYIIHKFEVEAKIKVGGVCDKRPCRTQSGCTASECKNEAAVIAETYVSRVNKIRKPNVANVGHIHWGWMCYQWAGLLTTEFNNLNLRCWKINWVGLVGAAGALLHNYIYVSLDNITPSGTEAPKRGCGMALDPWRTGDPIVYDLSWSWHKWNYVHDPSTNQGKSYDGTTWSSASYPPPWTPPEPTHSPTIKTP